MGIAFQKDKYQIVQAKEFLEQIVHRVQGQRYAQVASSYLVGQSAGISFRKLTRELRVKIDHVVHLPQRVDLTSFLETDPGCKQRLAPASQTL
jgi:hypothetical protein